MRGFVLESQLCDTAFCESLSYIRFTSFLTLSLNPKVDIRHTMEKKITTLQHREVYLKQRNNPKQKNEG